MAKLSNEWNEQRIKEILGEKYSQEQTKLIQEFAKYLEKANFTIESRKTKLMHLQSLFRQLGSNKISKLTEAEIEQYIGAADKREAKISLRYFFDWLKKGSDLKDFNKIQKDTRYKRIDAILNFEGFTDKQRKIIKDYYAFLQRISLKLESQRGYLQNAKLLLIYMKKEPEKWSKQDIDAYLMHINNNYKPKTIFDKQSFLVHFLEVYFDKKQEEIEIIRTMVLKKDKSTKLPEDILTPEDIKKMVQVADNFRDKAIIILLYETAARKGEFLQLKIKHIELVNQEYGLITIPQGKTDSRKVPIIYSIPHITNWLNSHPNRDNPNAPLFVTQGAWLGRPLGEDGIKRLVKILGKRAGINKKIYPHLFRHGRLTELAKELQEQELKKFAGWTPNSNMASVYVHLSGSDVSNKILANAGLIDTAEQQRGKDILKGIKCPRCKKFQAADIKQCSCGFILDIKEVNKLLEDRKRAAEVMNNVMQPQAMQEVFKMMYKLQRQLEELKAKS